MVLFSPARNRNPKRNVSVPHLSSQSSVSSKPRSSKKSEGRVKSIKRTGEVRKPRALSVYSKILILLAYVLLGIGMIFIFDASIFQGSSVFGDELHFVKSQLFWIISGSVFLLTFCRIDYKIYLGRRSIIVLALTFIVLILVLLISQPFMDRLFGGNIGPLVVGTETALGGASRWFIIRVGSRLYSLQPAEFAKISMIIYLASWLSEQRYTYTNLKEAIKLHFFNDLIVFLLIVGTIGFLVLIEPDMGTTMILLAVSFIIYFSSGTDIVHLGGSAALVVIFLIMILIAGVIAPYRFGRIVTFTQVFNTGQVPEADLHDTGYQIQQVLIGIGSGGFWGKGLGNSRQEYGYLVENTAFTDSVSAVILEETGYVGGIVLLLTYFVLLGISMAIANRANSKSGKLLAFGVGSWFMIQALFHLAANTSTIPFTGIPLPFFTYGGSSTWATMIGVGILVSVDRWG